MYQIHRTTPTQVVSAIPIRVTDLHISQSLFTPRLTSKAPLSEETQCLSCRHRSGKNAVRLVAGVRTAKDYRLCALVPCSTSNYTLRR